MGTAVGPVGSEEELPGCSRFAVHELWSTRDAQELGTHRFPDAQQPSQSSRASR